MIFCFYSTRDYKSLLSKCVQSSSQRASLRTCAWNKALPLSIKNSFICIFFFSYQLLSRIVSRYKACVLSTTSGRQFYRDFPIDFVLSRATPTMFFSHVRSFQLTIPRLPSPDCPRTWFFQSRFPPTPIVSVISLSRVRKPRINRRRNFSRRESAVFPLFRAKQPLVPGKCFATKG